MMQYQAQNLVNEVQRIINQLQQNERNNANTLRAIAGQLQNMAATENQATAMLQQLHSLTSQIALEASRPTNFGFQTAPAYEPLRSSPGSSLATNNVNPSPNSPLSGSPMSGGSSASGSVQSISSVLGSSMQS